MARAHSAATEPVHLRMRFWGLCARLYSKLAAHTLCLALNRATGATDVLQCKHLASVGTM